MGENSIKPLAAQPAREGTSPYVASKTCQTQREQENNEAIRAYNRHIEKNGLWNDRWRDELWSGTLK